VAWAICNVACAGETEDTNATTTDGASDPGNSGVSSAGDGVAEVDVYVAAGAGVAGLDPGKEVVNTVDGWTVDYDKLIVTVGHVRSESTDLALDGVSGEIERGAYVVDLRQGAVRQKLSRAEVYVEPFGSVEFADHEFDMAGASAASRLLEPATDADYDLMVKGGYSIYMEGTLSNPAGQSCDLEDPLTCTPVSTITFKWGLVWATSFTGCRGFVVDDDESASVTLTIPGDHWFRSNFTPDGTLPRRAQWIADADLDRNGETTLEELKMSKASLLFTPKLDYDLAGSPIPIDTAHDFLEAQVRTVGLNTENGCQKGIPIAQP